MTWKHLSGYPLLPSLLLPLRQVVVFTGLLRLLGSNDDELAAVLAHEVGHVLARHPVRGAASLYHRSARCTAF